MRRQADGRFAPDPQATSVERALERFRKFCRFDPATGCVVWIGGKTSGRGHNVPYGSFWFAGRRWFAHRWAAKFIHGFDIAGLQVDHCCTAIPQPNTLCVQHVQPLSGEMNRWLQTERRKLFIHLEVGLIEYADVYGPQRPDEVDPIPLFTAPTWLGDADTGDRNAECPF